jgi:hypothetical protein
MMPRKKVEEKFIYSFLIYDYRSPTHHPKEVDFHLSSKEDQRQVYRGHLSGLVASESNNLP